MSEKTVLVIDDSATIRRLVDGELSAVGYRVLVAPTAEEGLEKAANERPDLIILDHQLPGITGFEVACKLAESPDTARIPVVASSTLRKKAYAEYVDCDNVVDMLPKPYTGDLLITTVENAIETAAMVVQSQEEGSAVPEIIGEQGDADLMGTFACFGLREILDMLNNGNKRGLLEIESKRCRVFVHVDRGRIQAVTASGINPDEVAQQLPSSLSELGAVVKTTVGSRKGSEVDGLVGLLNNKVIDSRLLQKLLRLQAAVLLRICFTEPLKGFRFQNDQSVPPLFENLPLDSSLLAILVEGALICDESSLPQLSDETGYKRRSIRGQNLDRAGLASHHMKLMGSLSEPRTADELASQLSWDADEMRRVLHGFELAELVEQQAIRDTSRVVGITSDQELAKRLAGTFESQSDSITGKLLRDWLALELLLRRNRPDVLIVDLKDSSAIGHLQKMKAGPTNKLAGLKLVGVLPEGVPVDNESSTNLGVTLLPADFDDAQLIDAISVAEASPAAAPTSGDAATPVTEANQSV